MFLKGLVVTGEGLGITTAVNLLPLFILVVFLFNETLSATPLLVSLIQGDNNLVSLMGAFAVTRNPSSHTPYCVDYACASTELRFIRQRTFVGSMTTRM